jgi:hypothetical protein
MKASGMTAQGKNEAEGQTGRAVPKTGLGQALRAGLRESWDRLGAVIGISLTWIALCLVALTPGQWLPASVPLGLRIALVALWGGAILAGPTAGAFYVAYLASTHDEATYAAFWSGVRRFFRPALGLVWTQAAITAILAVNLLFYLSLRNGAGWAAAILCGYLLLFWGMQAQYHLPVLIAQEEGVFDTPEGAARRGVLAVLRRSALLTLGAPWFALGLLLVVLLISVAFLLSRFLFVLLWPGMLAMLLTYPTRALLLRFGVLTAPVPETVIPDAEFRLPEPAPPSKAKS